MAQLQAPNGQTKDNQSTPGQVAQISPVVPKLPPPIAAAPANAGPAPATKAELDTMKAQLIAEVRAVRQEYQSYWTTNKGFNSRMRLNSSTKTFDKAEKEINALFEVPDDMDALADASRSFNQKFRDAINPVTSLQSDLALLTKSRGGQGRVDYAQISSALGRHYQDTYQTRIDERTGIENLQADKIRVGLAEHILSSFGEQTEIPVVGVPNQNQKVWQLSVGNTVVVLRKDANGNWEYSDLPKMHDTLKFQSLEFADPQSGRSAVRHLRSEDKTIQSEIRRVNAVFDALSRVPAGDLRELQALQQTFTLGETAAQAQEMRASAKSGRELLLGLAQASYRDPNQYVVGRGESGIVFFQNTTSGKWMRHSDDGQVVEVSADKLPFSPEDAAKSSDLKQLNVVVGLLAQATGSPNSQAREVAAVKASGDAAGAKNLARERGREMLLDIALATEIKSASETIYQIVRGGNAHQFRYFQGNTCWQHRFAPVSDTNPEPWQPIKSQIRVEPGSDFPTVQPGARHTNLTIHWLRELDKAAGR